MNKKQLEEIQRLCERIRELINIDKDGLSWLEKAFNEFDSQVKKDLKETIWEEYKKSKEEK